MALNNLKENLNKRGVAEMVDSNIQTLETFTNLYTVNNGRNATV